MNYINLTNGIEAIPKIEGEYRFIRIQSTICELKLWDRLIQELDYDFLMHVALGDECIVYDFGASKPVPRALYQGIEFIKYVLHKRWLGQDYLTDINKGNDKEHIRKDCNSYFESCYKNLEERTKKKLDYFKPYVSGEINIKSVSDSTKHDGDREFYKRMLHNI